MPGGEKSSNTSIEPWDGRLVNVSRDAPVVRLERAKKPRSGEWSPNNMVSLLETPEEAIMWLNWASTLPARVWPAMVVIPSPALVWNCCVAARAWIVPMSSADRREEIVPLCAVW